jgi:hypothetical protein
MQKIAKQITIRSTIVLVTILSTLRFWDSFVLSRERCAGRALAGSCEGILGLVGHNLHSKGRGRSGGFGLPVHVSRHGFVHCGAPDQLATPIEHPVEGPKVLEWTRSHS